MFDKDKSEEKDQVKRPIDGCVVDWHKKVQVDPKTGAIYDFMGVLQQPKGKKGEEK